ncbi:hypothetical protein [Allorhizocola rhizosphaerae]|uniref:hypothetical protein n=1 Tax=Allorhizocola rhizosphaerae TaxID=1872709 RepID=UPI0013C357D7|nr:hypothetical protein [Allorhizocola rhizosphaerae]
MKNAMARLGVALGAAILMLGAAPGAVSAAPVEPATTAVVAVQQAGPVNPDGASWTVYCYTWGCEIFYTITAPTNYGQFWVFCNGWGWVAAPATYGQGNWYAWVNCGSYTPPLQWQFNWWV